MNQAQQGKFRDLYAQVAVDQPIDGELTYRIPRELAALAQAGSRVMVPLGRSNRATSGTILELRDESPATEPAKEAPAEQLFEHAEPAAVAGIKNILAIERDVPPVPKDLLELARWLSSYYCCPIGMTLATMVPAAVKKATRMPTFVKVSLATRPADAPAPKLSPQSRKAAEALSQLLAAGPLTQVQLLEHGFKQPMIKRLTDAGILNMHREMELPAPTGAILEPSMPGELLTLSAEQQAALKEINELTNRNAFAVRLIHGVTGSGKTEVYIRAIEEVVKRGKRAIVLVPEISLTPQTVRRFTRRFPRVAVLHSGMRDAQRHQHWQAVAAGWAQVVVGARSAIFAPISDLGLIVVDEEHDQSYKQDNAPKYHGRDVAIRRAQMAGCPVLLGSATPSLETWRNAAPVDQGGNPHYGGGPIVLKTRPTGAQLPRVQVVDMRMQSKERRGLHILSTFLEHHLQQTFAHKKQAILLLNRRGYAHYVMCPRCDWVLMCDFCDSTMVVHRNKPVDDADAQADNMAATHGGRENFEKRYGQVMCHYCSTAMVLPRTCPQCQAKLTFLGQGTQRAEDEVRRKFPGIRVARMDSDTMQNLQDYQETLDQFGHGDIDLLLGTQMIAKGLDFPNVSLVGVLNADLAMAMPDFRAAERTFQLICQVAGRAGRSAERGTVVLQTFQPEEPAIVHAVHHDYLGFVATELPHRQQFGYPPFGRMIRVLFSDKGYTKVEKECQRIAGMMHAVAQQQKLAVNIQGPRAAQMQRVQEAYRFEIVLQSPTPGPLQKLIAIMRHTLMSSLVDVAIDVDPLSML